MIAGTISTWAMRLNALLALVLGVATLCAVFFLWWRFHIHLPAIDLLRVMPFTQSVLEQGLTAQTAEAWFAPHAVAHRIATIRLLMVIDYRYWGGENHLFYATSWLSVLIVLAVLAQAFRQSYPARYALGVYAFGLALIFLCSPTQLWNFVNPVNSSWFVAMAASTVTIYLISRRSTPPSPLAFATIYLVAAIGAFSNFAGVIVWLVLPLLIGMRSLRAGLLAAAVSTVFVAIYLGGLTSDMATFPAHPIANGMEPNALDKLQFILVARLTQLVNVFAKTCVYLGAPLSVGQPVAASAMVIASLLLLALCWVRLLKARLTGTYRHSTYFEINLTMATVTLGVALVTQLARVRLAMPADPRYQTIVMFYWLCICGLLLCLALPEGKEKPRWQFGSSTGGLLIAALLLVAPNYSISPAARLSNTANQFAALGLLDVADRPVADILLPRKTSPRALTGLDPFFRETHTAHWHQPPRQLAVENEVACHNVRVAVTPSRWPGISLLRGRISDRWSSWYRQIPVTDSQGAVIGILTPLFRADVTAQSVLSGREDTWEAYVRDRDTGYGPVYLHYRTALLSDGPCRADL